MKLIKLSALLLFVSIALSSCYNESEPGTAKIIVKDQNDFRVPLADVTLTKEDVPPITGLTDLNGEFKHTYTAFQADMGLEVILDISVTKGNATGSGVIRIIPGEENEEEITIFL